MADFKRAQRVERLLKEELGKILRADLKDPHLGLITVTKVVVADDLKSAKAYVSMLGEREQRESALTSLEKAVPFIRHLIGRRTKLRYVPTLIFFYDDTQDYVDSINSLLKKIHEE